MLVFTYFIFGHSHALICTYICTFNALFLQLENDLREIETTFFITSFYSEMYFKNTTYKNIFILKCISKTLLIRTFNLVITIFCRSMLWQTRQLGKDMKAQIFMKMSSFSLWELKIFMWWDKACRRWLSVSLLYCNLMLFICVRKFVIQFVVGDGGGGQLWLEVERPNGCYIVQKISWSGMTK